MQWIGNKDIPSCYKGCKEAAKYPELKKKMDIVITKHNAGKAEREALDKINQRIFNRCKYVEARNAKKTKGEMKWPR